jgi:hypothetical protein
MATLTLGWGKSHVVYLGARGDLAAGKILPSRLTIRLALPYRKKNGAWYDILCDEMREGEHVVGRVWEIGWNRETNRLKTFTTLWQVGLAQRQG